MKAEDLRWLAHVARELRYWSFVPCTGPRHPCGCPPVRETLSNDCVWCVIKGAQTVDPALLERARWRREALSGCEPRRLSYRYLQLVERQRRDNVPAYAVNLQARRQQPGELAVMRYMPVRD